MDTEQVGHGINRWNEPILSTTQTKRQHFVPCLYLNNFARADGKIRVFDLQGEREFVSSPENVAVQARFYDITLEDQHYSAEDWLAELESDASGVLRLLGDDPPAIESLTDEQENALSRFIAALIIRTPFKRQELNDTFDAINSQIEQILRGQFAHQFGEPQGLAKYEEWQAMPLHERYGEEEPTQPASTTNFLLGEVQGFANLLRAAPWRIGNTLGDRRLYTSDNPVSRYLRPVRPWWEVGAFSSFDYFLPLSPELLLKIERRQDSPDSEEDASPWGERRKKDFSEWEVSMARHIISRDASRYVYGDGLVVPKHCAVSCLDRIESATREFASRYLGYDPSPPAGLGFPFLADPGKDGFSRARASSNRRSRTTCPKPVRSAPGVSGARSGP